MINFLTRQKKNQLTIKKSIALFVLFFSLTLCAQALETAQIKKGDVLSLKDCVSLAINNSPIIKKYEYNLQIAQSNVGIAKSAYFPTLGAGTSIYQDYNTSKDYNGSSNRDLPSVGVTFNQLIWNFGKASSLIRMEQFYRLGAQYQFMDSICNTIYDVKVKYYAVLKEKAIVEIEQNNVLINEQNYEQVKKLYSQKKKPEIDVINAQVYLSDSKMRLLDAKNKYENALEDLRNSLYIAYAPDFEVKELPSFVFKDDYDHTFEIKENDSKKIKNVALKTKIEKNTTLEIKKLPFSLQKSFVIANDSSPDLWILESTKKAMQESLVFVKRQYYPDLTGNVGYGYNNSKDYSNNSLNMSLNLSSALNIKQLKHEVERAQAQVDLAGNEIDLFKQNLYFEVKKAYINVEKNEKQIPIAQQKEQQAFENFKLAKKRYENGEADYILLQDARRNYTDAKILYVDTLYHYNVSLANLEISMHYHFDDIHHQIEHAIHFHYRDLIHKLEDSLHCEHKNEEEKHPASNDEDL